MTLSTVPFLHTSWMLVPFAQNSSPIAVPHSIASVGSQVAPMLSDDGHWVDVPGGEESSNPCGPLSLTKIVVVFSAVQWNTIRYRYVIQVWG